MEENLKPRFIESLQRNNDQIREDRARIIGEDAELIYRRRVEDIELKIKRLEREQEGLIDISPLDKNSLTFADFQPEAFVQRDIELSLIIRNLNIQLELTRTRFEYLFGKNFKLWEVQDTTWTLVLTEQRKQDMHQNLQVRFSRRMQREKHMNL